MLIAAQKISRWFGWAIASGLLVLSLGSYQMDLGCECVTALAALIVMLAKGKDREAKTLALQFGASVIVACLVYKALWDIIMRIFSL